MGPASAIFCRDRPFLETKLKKKTPKLRSKFDFSTLRPGNRRSLLKMRKKYDQKKYCYRTFLEKKLHRIWLS